MNSVLKDYVRVLRVRWRWLVGWTLLAVGTTTLLLVLLPPVYQSDATVFVRTPGDVSRVVDGGDTYARARAQTYAALADSRSTAARVITDLGLELDPETLSERIHASNPRGTALINVKVSGPTAEEADRIATAFLSEYSATVRQLESVPGSLAPRAEIVVVDPPGRPQRILAWGAPVSIVLGVAALIGLLCGATAAVLRSIFDGSTGRRPRTKGAEKPALANFIRRVRSVSTRKGRVKS